MNSSKIIHSAKLSYYDWSENSDKFYNLEIKERDGEYYVNARYGRQGSYGTTSEKAYRVDYPTAMKAYQKTLASKIKKGYVECK